MAWRRLITQVQRHQSEFGKAKHLFTRNYISPTNKFQDCTRNRLFFSQQRFKSSNLGNMYLSEAKEASHLKILSHQDGPEAVISAFESQPSLHTNSVALSEYVKALVQVDGLDESELLKSLRRDSCNSAKEEGSTILGIGDFGWFLIRVVAQILWFVAVIMLKASDKAVQPILETNTKLSDVEGVDEEAMAELEEIVDYIRNHEEYTHQGGKLPKCVLLCGPSSTDKTMLAKTIAGEAGVSFFQRNGSKFDERDKFDEENDGVGAQRVMDFFADAKKQSPCIIFIDDIDAVGGSRNHERQTLNQMLVELDILKQNEGILVIGATNFPELLDKALARPGRFDRHVVIDRSRRTLTNFGISCVKGSESG
ncbi:hypothetical protein P8452_23454 [Trifolium repens]|nr:hypothetical protein P8452_23454 [Trifolium repens]